MRGAAQASQEDGDALRQMIAIAREKGERRARSEVLGEALEGGGAAAAEGALPRRLSRAQVPALKTRLESNILLFLERR